MSKNIDKKFFYDLPSGQLVHPSRLIVRDGTIMWKHALTYNDKCTNIPSCQAHEAHIVKTANRLEELNAWVSQGLEPWECLKPLLWYNPNQELYSEGIRVSFKHLFLDNDDVFDVLKDHIMPHESLLLHSNVLTFIRC